jgi:WD40 repeat protein
VGSSEELRGRRPVTGQRRAAAGLGRAAVALALVGCGGASGELAATEGAELRVAGAAARGVLAYAVAFAREPEPLLVSIELGATFDLVTRSLDPRGGVRERGRAVLGPADWDVSDLALVGGGRGGALVASGAGTVRRLDLATGRVVATWHVGAGATAVAVTRDGRLAATGSASGVVCLRRLADGALLQCLVAHGAAVSGLDFDAAGGRLASSSWDGRVAVWSVPQLAEVAALDAGGSANQVAFAPDGGRLAVAVSGEPPRRTPEVAARERSGTPPVDPRAGVLVWVPSRGAGAIELRGHRAPVTSVAWLGDGRRLLSASWDRTVRLWDAGSARELARVSGFSHLLRDLAVARAGGWVAAAAWAARGDDPATVLLALRHPP